MSLFKDPNKATQVSYKLELELHKSALLLVMNKKKPAHLERFLKGLAKEAWRKKLG